MSYDDIVVNPPKSHDNSIKIRYTAKFLFDNLIDLKWENQHHNKTVTIYSRYNGGSELTHVHLGKLKFVDIINLLGTVQWVVSESSTITHHKVKFCTIITN